MLDRLFGRNKDESQEPTCAACGRTLLPGEWAQTVVNDDGVEQVICSLCAQAELPAEPAQEALAADATPIAVSGRPQPLRPRSGRETRNESDAFWRTLKEKDAEIARLQAELAGAEAERQELRAQVALLQRQLRGEAITDWQAAAPFEAQPTQRPAALAADAEGSAAVAASVGAQTQPFDFAAEEGLAAAQLSAARGAAGPNEDVGSASGDASPVAEVENSTAAAAEAHALPSAAGVAGPQTPAAGRVASDAMAKPANAATEGPQAQVAGQPQPVAETRASVSAEAAQVAPFASDENEATAGIPLPPAIQPGGALAAEEAHGPSWLFDTPPHQTFGDATAPLHLPAEEPTAAPEAAAAPETAAPGELQRESPVAAPLFPKAAQAAPQPAGEHMADAEQQPPAEPELPLPTAEELAAQAEQLVILQRGADLLNVSAAPRKIAETSENLGIPLVHLASDGQTMTAILLWSMAWYEYHVDLSTGEVKLAERGYDDRPDLRPNAKARSDGTIQVAPIARRATSITSANPPAATPDPRTPAIPGKADIISKSLKGQRTDDEAVAWDQMSARDFDWGR